MNDMKDFVSARYTVGELNRLVECIQRQAGDDGVERLCSGELEVIETRPWRKKDGVIYLSVTSNGVADEEWINRFGVRMGVYAKSILQSLDFRSTTGVTTEVAILTGGLFDDKDRTMKKVHAEGVARGLTKPSIEVACLLREMLGREDFEAMGLQSISVMHEPVTIGSSPYLLSLSGVDTERQVDTCAAFSPRRRRRQTGFAFAMSSASS